MTQTKNMQWIYAGVGILLACIVFTMFTSGVFAENRNRFRRGVYSPETREAIHTAFESNDYSAYVNAVGAGENGRKVLTEEEFTYHAGKMARKNQIHEALSDGDYAAYRTLTDGSIHQLSESAFHKKSQMLAIKEDLKTALEDRDYETFVAKKQELRDLLGDEYPYRGDDREEMTEEKFTELADKLEQNEESGFFKKRRRSNYGGHYGKSSRRKR